MENRGKRQATSIFGGMGFYIALLICVLAAGVVGYYALLKDNTVTHEQETVMDPIIPEPVQSVTAPDPEPAEPVISQEPVKVQTPVRKPQTVAEDPPVPVVAAEVLPEEPEVIQTPVVGETVAVFSIDRLTYDATLGDWRTHDGIDIRAAAGDPVTAAASGTVLSVEEDDRLGTMVVIDHNNGYITTYASLQQEVPVLVGDAVTAGTVLGTVGNTSLSEAGLGAHLHFSVARDGTAIDPMEYLGE